MNLSESKKILLAIILVDFVFLFYFAYRNPNISADTYAQNNLSSVSTSTVFSIQEEAEVVGLPVRIRIPRINVDAFVEKSGVGLDGSMGSPKGPDGAVWFDLGKRPGENGSAVIAGHYGWKNGIPAVFDNLYRLRSGDNIYIEDDRGVTISFVVRENRRYDSNTNPPEVFSSNDEKAHLNLITCEGAWDDVAKSYSKRLVVFADKE